MTFDIFIKAKVLDDLPQSRKKQVAEALKDLKNGFQGESGITGRSIPLISKRMQLLFLTF